MVSISVQNFSNFLKNKPPLVVFLLCLIILAASTSYFAFQIEKDKPIVDSDKKLDWINMVKHFNKVDICISPIKGENETNPIKEGGSDTEDQISVFTSVEIIEFDVFNSFSEVYGFLTLDDWYSVSCQDSKQPKNMTILFSIPEFKSVDGSQNLCVTVKGPAQYLPYFKKSACTPQNSSNQNKGNIGFLSSKLPKNSNQLFCEDGKIAKIVFDLQHEEISNYLSDDVRTQIYLHLVWCTYFLIFVIFIFLLYILIKKSDYLEKKEQLVHNVRLL
ncbi:transmembrane protein 248-like [Sitophilus oryzae]|uniref:Transmembrane protein 248-like n=1 Tax=Sitophilus oryzae TaxID=7048 RepID=A0A6J2Y931_SITOR|nr:transmembrane protein 248-like [Sitophilus oryzae]XP_030759689.1 transmembrane protein 248-like [Sitophilus oryzae]